MPVIEIHAGNKIAVLISVFNVEPENEQKLIELFMVYGAICK
jgi:hypothetical protein